MLKILYERLNNQGYRTTAYPDAAPAAPPERFRGLPVIDSGKCPAECRDCVEACPTGAIAHDGRKLSIDLGKCLFCTDCVEACPPGAIAYSRDYRLAVRNRADLIYDGHALKLAQSLDEKSQRIFGRSLKLRQVSAAGCNGCEADVNVLTTIVFDLGRFGIQFVASPRHADGLLVTGCVSQNMKFALQNAYESVPAPKFVIAVGACAISGGPFIDHPEQNNGAGSVVPVDLYIPGCPPHPLTILDGLLRLIGRLEREYPPAGSQPEV